jgi:hypothetical protein
MMPHCPWVSTRIKFRVTAREWIFRHQIVGGPTKPEQHCTSMRMARRLNASASGDIRRDYGAFVAIFLNAYCVRGRGLDRRTQVTGRVWCTCHVCQVVGVRRVDGVRQKRPGRAAHPLTREPRAEAGVAWQPCICPTGRTYSRRARPCVACCRKRYRHREKTEGDTAIKPQDSCGVQRREPIP